MTNVGFNALTFTVVPVIQNTGTDAAPVWTPATITAGTVVAGILDPVSGINRMYNPSSVGFTPTAGDAVGKWLPAVAGAGLTSVSVQDNYWTPVTGNSGGNKYGQFLLTLTAGTADTVRASSVMQFRLSPNAFVLTTTGTFA
jgi:hypothetical protein